MEVLVAAGAWSAMTLTAEPPAYQHLVMDNSIVTASILFTINVRVVHRYPEASAPQPASTCLSICMCCMSTLDRSFSATVNHIAVAVVMRGEAPLPVTVTCTLKLQLCAQEQADLLDKRCKLW